MKNRRLISFLSLFSLVLVLSIYYVLVPVNNATLTIQTNGTEVAVFTANSAINQIANIISEFRCKMNVEYKLKDIYENKQTLGDNKAMTINFVISSNEHTLSAGEIEGFRKRLLDHFKQRGISLR